MRPATRRRAGRGAGCLVAGLGLVLLLGLLMLAALVGSLSGQRQDSSAWCTMPGGVMPSGTTTVAGSHLSQQQMANAQTIVAVGRQMDIHPYGWVVAVATALQESRLENLSYGDRDSLGLFQQRPSAGWGTPQQVTAPTYAARQFYEHLQQVPGWQRMPLTHAAQAVQRSAFPLAYAQHEPLARQIVQHPAALAAQCQGSGGLQLVGHSTGANVVRAALQQIGVPYSWGGGGIHGPSYGIAHGAGIRGFDCSGLTTYAWYQAAGVRMPSYTGAQWAYTEPVPRSQVQAGDLLFFPGHVGIYDGQGGMVHSPQTGETVERVRNVLQDPYWSSQLQKIGRPPLKGSEGG